MSNSKVLFQELSKSIHLPDNRDEIESIVYIILEHQFGITRSDVMAGKEITNEDSQSLNHIIARINTYEPVQYILGQADFFGRKFFVDPSVLIPRQETEVLISEILKRRLPANPKILDIGTGSGCIAITLALEIPGSLVTATDISKEALSVAVRNANTVQANVEFIHHDILQDTLPWEGFDLVVSNPPYISAGEKNKMHRNVLDYEPHLALFSEKDPLLFYKNIADKGRKALNEKGVVLVEINEHFSNETLSIFKAAHFSNCAIIKDIQEKDRVIIAYQEI
jgi:release factor glutamine methyltransferase